jgi:dihydropteroate synthase
MIRGVQTKIGNAEFQWGQRTYVMGIINITPDSFSGDGLSGVEAALIQARRMVSEGADILDIGGESTKPGFQPVAVEEEIRRVVPVIRRLASEIPTPLSIDSYKYEVVQQALEAGASLINDQWGLKSESRLAALAVRYKAPLILMSNQRDKGAFSAALQRDTGSFPDILAEVVADLGQSIRKALASGLAEENIIVDPGLGFGKTWQHDLEIIRRLGELKVLNRPILLGPSRKSFIKMILGLPPLERVEGSAAAVALGIAHGADIVRVHDVKEIARVCKIADAIERGIAKPSIVIKEQS